MCRQRHPRKAARFKNPATSRTPPPTQGAIGLALGKLSHGCEYVLRFHRRAPATQHRRVKTPKRRWSKHRSRPALRLHTQFCIGCAASSVHRAADEMHERRRARLRVVKASRPPRIARAAQTMPQLRALDAANRSEEDLRLSCLVSDAGARLVTQPPERLTRKPTILRTWALR